MSDNIADLVQSQLKSMTPQQTAQFRRELVKALPVAIQEAAEKAKQLKPGPSAEDKKDGN